MLGIILVGVAVICAFTFPVFLIEAIREENAETAKTAKNMACVTFGVLIFVVGIFMILVNV